MKDWPQIKFVSVKHLYSNEFVGLQSDMKGNLNDQKSMMETKVPVADKSPKVGENSVKGLNL